MATANKEITMPHRIDRARFFSKLKLNTLTGCMEWSGETKNGYGVMYSTGGKFRAHRVAAYLAGLIDNPRGVTNGVSDTNVLHRCDNPICCNPAHLFVGSHADNMADMVSKGRGLLQKLPDFVGPHRHPKHTKRERTSRQMGRPPKYSDEEVAEIRLVIAAGIYSQSELARKMGVSQGWISLVCSGKTRNNT